jgi:hypothetical protein
MGKKKDFKPKHLENIPKATRTSTNFESAFTQIPTLKKKKNCQNYQGIWLYPNIWKR